MTTDNSMTSHHSKKKRIDDQQSSTDKTFQVQRRRVWRACENCRRKKIKCDGNEPVCTQCTTTKNQCTWLQTKDRAALSRHYVQELETRLVQMETLFTQITPVLEQLGQSTDAVPSQPSSSQTPGHISPSSASLIQSVLPKVLELKAGTTDELKTEPMPDEIESDMSETFDQLALDEHGHLRWIGETSTMSLIQAFRALTMSPMDRVSPMEDDPRSPGPSANKLYFPASVFFGRVRALPGPEDVEYPDRDLADKLVEAYFARFHSLLPILDKPTFLRQYAYLMQHTHNPTPAGVEVAFISLVFSVFACAARFVEDSRLSTGPNDDGGMGMVYYERALILHYITHASIQVSHVQIFSLMSAFLCSINCLPQAWLLTGQAVRSAQDLGLHRSPRRLTISPTEKETRRKIWWGVYTMDRMLALALGRPLGIEDSDCDVELPADVEDECLPEYFSGAKMTSKQPSLMAGFIALVCLYKIGGKILRKVYALEAWKDFANQDRKEELQHTVETLDNELTKWCEELPIVFKSAPITDQQVSVAAVLCSHYYSVLTTLHRNFLPGRRDQPITAKSTARALSSARSCIRLAPSMKNVVPSSLHSTFFLQNLFSSAVIILLYAMHVADAQASNVAMDEAKTCLDAIESWEGSWPGARKCKELLLDLTTTASEAIMKKRVNTPQMAPPPSESSRPGPNTVKSRPERPKKKPGRPRSRDIRHSGLDPVSLAEESLRARSTSRKRPHDDDGFEGSPIRAAYSPYQRHSRNLSNHSSPASVASAPSPTLLNEPNPDTSINMMEPPSLGQTNGQSPTLQTSPTSPIDYNFSAMMAQNTSPIWEEQGGEQGFYPSDQQNPYVFGTSAPHIVDQSYAPFDEMSLGGMGSMMDLPPPSENFTASGLPFRGLEFIRNYTTDTYFGDQSLWQGFDAGAFGYDPDIPFTLRDGGDGQLFPGST